MWAKLKASGFGLMACRLGAAGFLLFFLCLPSSGQAFSAPPAELSQPQSPQAEPGATLTERLTLALQMWVDWYKTSYLPWSETDKQWKRELSTSWLNLSDSLESQKAEVLALRLENEALKAQLAQAKNERWIFGAVGLGIGAGGAFAISIVVK